MNIYYGSPLLRGCQPKATTLACVLVRMVALVLIFEYFFLNTSPLYMINHIYKATNIYEYFMPYVCFMSPSLNLHLKCKILSPSPRATRLTLTPSHVNCNP